MGKPRFTAGRNIAMKVPPHQYEETVKFYRDLIGLKDISTSEEEVGFEFGGKNLWIDAVPSISQAEIWLEILTDDIDNAANAFKDAGVIRRDEIEILPDDLQAFWVSSPSSIIHLICKETDSW